MILVVFSIVPRGIAKPFLFPRSLCYLFFLSTFPQFLIPDDFWPKDSVYLAELGVEFFIPKLLHSVFR